MTRALLPILYGLAVLLLATVAVEFRQQAALPTTTVATPALPPAPVPRPAASIADDNQVRSWVATILARPLFSRDRRPASAAAGPVLVADRLPRLTGITVSPAGRHAIFAGSGGKPVVASPGDRLGGFTVRTIEPGQVTVTGPGGSRVLRPSFSEAPPAAAAASSPERPLAGRLPVFRGRFPESEFNRAVPQPAAIQP